MAECFSSVSEDELCEKCIIKQLLNLVLYHDLSLYHRERRKFLIKCSDNIITNHKNYNFLACGWFKNVLFFTNSLAKLLSDSLLLDILLLDSLLSDSLISQSHSKM